MKHVPAVSRGEALYLGAVIALLVIAVASGGDPVLPYIGLIVLLLPWAYTGLPLLALTAGAIAPDLLAGMIIAAGVLAFAVANIAISRVGRRRCATRRAARIARTA